MHLLARWKRRKLLKRAMPKVLRRYLELLPLTGSIELSSIALLATDLELTGLDARSDEIVSIGTVGLDLDGIRLKSGREKVIRSVKGVGQSAVCHQLTDQDLLQGVDRRSALLNFFQLAAGKVLLFHHGQLDLRFIRKACREEFSWVPPFVYMDTQVIEQRRRSLAQPEIPMHQLRLPQCRQCYGLPEVHGHRALSDAVACGELLLAQLARQGDTKPKLREYWLFG